MSKLIYISGKITGIADGNKQKFEEAEQRLRAAGYVPINPHKIHSNDYNYTWVDYMKADIKALMDCGSIAVLDDWNDSPGAVLEVKLALSLNMKMICAHTLKVLESSDQKEMTRIPTKAILKSLKREIGFRKSVYKTQVMRQKMTQAEADHEIRVMEQIESDYKDLMHLGASSARPIQTHTQSSLFN